ncbi:hypothetical protein [Desulfosporosinus metallidurans]|uniref:hypothetical protein n=1 Tax=Desulfosporosinus metallidurans TaxID=1888891 RepID=UPI00094BF662|nr:hypothetical protein [Desulfosporosinus metallidurans]
MPDCYFCCTELRWSSDFAFDDCGIEGDGIVATFSCPECGATAEFTSKITDEDEDVNKYTDDETVD